MTAADQPPAELVEKAARAIHDRICDCPDYGNGCGRWPTEDAAEHVLAAVWPLVLEREQRAVRDAKVETLDEAIRRLYNEVPLRAIDMLTELRREVQS